MARPSDEQEPERDLVNATEIVEGRAVQHDTIEFSISSYPAASESSDPVRTGDRISATPVLPWEQEHLKEQVSAERYTILGKIGEGGMAVVYVARDEALRRHVALKLRRSEREISGARFVEEMQVLGQLEHPNIVPLYTLESGKAGTPFSTMRYLRGSSLEDVLKGLRANDPAMSEYTLTRLMQIFLQITQAVSYAHSKGVVHRDLKPANVMLGEHGEVQVVDFGIAKLASASEVQTDSQSRMTVPGQILGTPAYMAPEQWAGAPIDERADIYSLGVMLYELLTLQRPFDGGNPLAFCQAVLMKAPIPPRTLAPDRSIPLELEETCLKALGKAPELRQENVRELNREVQAWLETETDKARRKAMAHSKVEEARGLLLAYHEQRQRVAELELRVREIAAAFKTWQGVAEKQPVYAAEREVLAARRQLIDTSTDVVGVLTEALGFERENSAARELLAEYYWDRLLEAEGTADQDQADFYARLVRLYHDGKFARKLSGEGTLTLTTEPSGARVRLHRLEEVDLRLQPEKDVGIGASPIEAFPIAQGSYLAKIELPGYRTARYPVYISRNRDWHEHVRLHTDAAIGEGFCCVPAGPFIEGGDREGWSVPRGEPRVDDFAIARHPVTVAEYVEFLNALAQTDFELARRRAPRRTPDGGSYALYDDQHRVHVPPDLPDGIGEPNAPVSGVSWHDAMAYCEWRSARDGRHYRLPTSREWEKAARGVDGRWFPWGNRFDASLCNIRESMRVAPRAASVEDFPTDESIYGVRGMAGNMREWTATEFSRGSESPGLRVVRGGAWYGGRVSARCADQFWFESNHVYFFVGFRLAHSLA
jgi:eukaryotic-like serine/threonine-protein kinase